MTEEDIISFFTKLSTETGCSVMNFYTLEPEFTLTKLGTLCLVFTGVQAANCFFKFLKEGDK